MSTCQLPRPVPAVWDAALSNGGGGGGRPCPLGLDYGGADIKELRRQVNNGPIRANRKRSWPMQESRRAFWRR